MPIAHSPSRTALARRPFAGLRLFVLAATAVS